MKVASGEEIAAHTGPESCGASREGGVEALTGERAGRVLSREIHAPLRKQWVLRGADAVEVSGRRHLPGRYREARRGPARAETPSTDGNIPHGNPEIPPVPAAAPSRTRTSKGVRSGWTTARKPTGPQGLGSR